MSIGSEASIASLEHKRPSYDCERESRLEFDVCVLGSAVVQGMSVLLDFAYLGEPVG